MVDHYRLVTNNNQAEIAAVKYRRKDDFPKHRFQKAADPEACSKAEI